MQRMLPEKRRFNILCLSGGGYRGLFSAAVLRHLQKGLKIPKIADHFDLIIGTSTGALVGCGLAAGLSAREIEISFRKNGLAIFPERFWIEKLFWRLQLRAQYGNKPLIETIRGLLPEIADRNIEDIQLKLAIVALSQVSRRHRLFCGAPFALPSVNKTSIIDALLATSAAPTYFPSHKPADGLDILVDGGLVANAPVLLGAALLRERIGAPLDKIHVLHIGTAGSRMGTSFKDPWYCHLPLIAWARRLNAVTADLVDLTISAQEALAIDLASTFFSDRYIHLDVPPEHAQNPELRSLDDASKPVSQKLLMLAEKTWLHWANTPALHAFFPVQHPVLDFQKSKTSHS